jgi:MFS family permease
VRAIAHYLGFAGQQKLPKQLRMMMTGITISAIGNGVIMPFFFIYMTNVRGIHTATAGLILGWGGLISLLAAPLVGTAIDRYGPRRILAISLIISAAGYSSFAFVKSASLAFLVATVCAIGQAGMWPAQTSVNTQLTADHQREHVYGLQFALLNFGIGLGAFLGAVTVDIDNVQTFQFLFFGNGATFLLYFLAVMALGPLPHPEAEQESEEGSWQEVIADRTFRQFWWVALGAIFFGYSQIEVGFASFVVNVAGAGTEKLAWAAGANTLTIALFQMWFISRVRRFSRRSGIVTAISIWALAWIFIAIGGFISGGWWLPTLFFVGGWVVFAIGEMIWSPLAPAIVNQLAPDHLRGRYNSASAASWQIGAVFGPVIAGALIGNGLAWHWIVGCITGSIVTAIMATRITLPEREMA